MVLEALILIPHYKWDPSGQIYFWHKSVYFKGDTLGKNLAHFKLQFKAAKSSWRDPENFFFITFTISILCLFTLVCHDVNYQPLKTNKKYHHSKCKLTTRTSTELYVSVFIFKMMSVTKEVWKMLYCIQVKSPSWS